MLALLLAAALYVGYAEILPLAPQSTHQWRQADCASMASLYHQEGMDFFEPRLHNQFAASGRAVGELPLMPYLAAIGYQLFGQHDGIYRLLVCLFWFIGLLALFRTQRIFLKGWFWPGALTLLFFSSPLLAYYGNNFLSDVPALGMSLVGWWLVARYYQKSSAKWLWMALAFFLLATVLKITAGIGLVTVMCLWGLETVFRVKLGKDDTKLFGDPPRGQSASQ